MKRDDYVRRMNAVMDRMRVKAGLAKLELRDARHGLAATYDTLRERLRAVAGATDDRFDALRQGCDAAWHAFKQRFDAAVSRRRAGTPDRSSAKDQGGRSHAAQAKCSDQQDA